MLATRQGDALFQTHENLEHLAMMDTVLGHVPSSMVARADRHSQTHYFRATRDNTWTLHWPEGSSSRDSLRAVRKLRPLRELVAAQAGGPAGAAFADLMEGLLRYEPAARTTPRNALRHPFFTGAGWAAPLPPAEARRASGSRPASGGTQRAF
jgi:dual-specificity kinase